MRWTTSGAPSGSSGRGTASSPLLWRATFGGVVIWVYNIPIRRAILGRATKALLSRKLLYNWWRGRFGWRLRLCRWRFDLFVLRGGFGAGLWGVGHFLVGVLFRAWASSRRAAPGRGSRSTTRHLGSGGEKVALWLCVQEHEGDKSDWSAESEARGEEEEGDGCTGSRTRAS
jgi:hypothetical protein